MDTIEKLFLKIPKQDRLLIEQVLQQVSRRNFTGLNRVKLKGYSCIYRIRTGNYRIIYYDDGQEILLKAIKKRDESTYRNL